MKIRQYQVKDYKDVQSICIGGSQDFNGYDILLNMYCNYYIEQEPENVFVLSDENDKAVGYIFCAIEWGKYKNAYDEKYLPQLIQLSEKHYKEKIDEYEFLKDIVLEYPAHLHIDIEEGYRSSGYGSKLVMTLIEKLKSNGVKGLMLCVGVGNTNAHRI